MYYPAYFTRLHRSYRDPTMWAPCHYGPYVAQWRECAAQERERIERASLASRVDCEETVVACAGFDERSIHQ